MNEFKHFLRKIAPTKKEALMVILLGLLGYVEYKYLNTIIIWFIALVFIIINTWINIHFWKVEKKMFKKYELKGKLMVEESKLVFEEHDRRMKEAWKTMESKDVKN